MDARSRFVQTGGQTKLSPNHLKISWFSNGNHLHSSSDTNTFNVSSLASLFELAGRPSNLRLSCIYEMVIANPSDNLSSFHANQIKRFSSSNIIEIRLRVEPELNRKRVDLMPTIKSFSDNELVTNPSQKFRLTCTAQCEPVCGLAWFIGDKPIEPMHKNLGPTTKTFVELSEASINLQKFDEFVAPIPFPDQSRDNEFELTQTQHNPSPPNLIRFEMISKRQMRSPDNGNESTYWSFGSLIKPRLRTMHDTPEFAPSALVEEFRKTAEGRDASLIPVNVVSTLELNYNQIRSLLLSGFNEPLKIKCGFARLNWPFKYELVGYKNVWFPSSDKEQAAMLIDSLDYLDKDLKQFGEIETSIFLNRPPRDVRIIFESALGLGEESPFGLSFAESQLIELSDPNKQKPLLKCIIKGSTAFPAPTYTWLFTHLNGTEERLTFLNGNEVDIRQLIGLRQQQNSVDPVGAYGFDVVSSLSGNYTCIASNIHGSTATSLPIQIHGRPLCKLTLGAEHLDADNTLSADLKCSVYSVPPMLEAVWFKGNRELGSNKSEMFTELNTNPINAPLTSLRISIPILNKNQDFLQADLSNPESNYKCLIKNSVGFSEFCELSSQQKHLILDVLKIASGKQQQDAGSMWPLAGWPMFNSNNNQLGLHQQQQFSARSNSFLANARLDLILGAACCLLFIYLIFLFVSSFMLKRKRKGLSLKVPKHTSWHFTSLDRHQDAVGVSNINRKSNRLGGPFIESSSSHHGVNYYGGSNGDSEHDIIQSCSQSSQYEDLLGGANNNLSSNSSSNNLQRIVTQNYQSQALYFNHQLATSAATMNRRNQITSNNKSRANNLNPSMPQNDHQRTTELNCSNGMVPQMNPMDNTTILSLPQSNQVAMLRDLAGPYTATSRQSNQRGPTATIKNTSGFNNYENKRNLEQQQILETGRKIKNIYGTNSGQQPSELILASGQQAPLIDGTQTSRIRFQHQNHIKSDVDQSRNLNHQQRNGLVPENNYDTTNLQPINHGIIANQATPQLTEHIYDDVIYKQMIL